MEDTLDLVFKWMTFGSNSCMVMFNNDWNISRSDALLFCFSPMQFVFSVSILWQHCLCRMLLLVERRVIWYLLLYWFHCHWDPHSTPGGVPASLRPLQESARVWMAASWHSTEYIGQAAGRAIACRSPPSVQWTTAPHTQVWRSPPQGDLWVWVWCLAYQKQGLQHHWLKNEYTNVNMYRITHVIQH